MCSASSTDRFSGSARRRRSTRRRRQSVCPTSDDHAAKLSAQTTRPAAAGTRTASWSANFDNLLHDCAGLATFSVSAPSDVVTGQLADTAAASIVVCFYGYFETPRVNKYATRKIHPTEAFKKSVIRNIFTSTVSCGNCELTCP